MVGKGRGSPALPTLRVNETKFESRYCHINYVTLGSHNFSEPPVVSSVKWGY